MAAAGDAAAGGAGGAAAAAAAGGGGAAAEQVSLPSLADLGEGAPALRVAAAVVPRGMEADADEEEETPLVLTVHLNRPRRKNALNPAAYWGIVRSLSFAADEPRIRAVVLTGAAVDGGGDNNRDQKKKPQQQEYYSSGNDLGIFSQVDVGDDEKREAAMRDNCAMLQAFLDAFIEFPKPLLAAVNGPAIGVAATTLSFADFVYAAEGATFSTPFAKTAQAPEAGSSELFPAMMGPRKAAEILMLGDTFSAEQAVQSNLATAVVKGDTAALLRHTYAVAGRLAYHPPRALARAKALIRTPERKKELSALCAAEIKVLVDCWNDEEFAMALMRFMARPKL